MQIQESLPLKTQASNTAIHNYSTFKLLFFKKVRLDTHKQNKYKNGTQFWRWFKPFLLWWSLKRKKKEIESLDIRDTSQTYIKTIQSDVFNQILISKWDHITTFELLNKWKTILAPTNFLHYQHTKFIKNEIFKWIIQVQQFNQKFKSSR